jgi:hypothetical protein
MRVKDRLRGGGGDDGVMRCYVGYHHFLSHT